MMAKLPGFCLVILYFLSFGDLISGQRPNLPPSRQKQKESPQIAFSSLPPLLPAVPSVEFVERLTKAQLAFIRLHQEIQKNDKTPYNPYACLPKYICIIQDKDGTKRTAVVNGLHPALRDIPGANKMNEPYLPGKSNAANATTSSNAYTPSGRNDLEEDIDPETAFQNQQRLAHDDFLRDQELAEQVALEAEYQRRQKLRKNSSPKQKPSSSPDSGEDSTESEEESGESQPQAAYYDSKPVAVVPWDDRRPVQKNFTRGATTPTKSSRPGLLDKFKNALPIPVIMPKIFRRRQLKEPTPSSTNPNKSLIRRMLQFRGKRDTQSRADIATPFLTQLGPGIKSSDQCRILYNGCELDYDQIMQIAEEGQVLIEGDDPTTPPKQQQIYKLKLRPEDDEAELAAKLYNSKKKKKPSLYKITNHKNGNKQAPAPQEIPKDDDADNENSDEEEEGGQERPVRIKTVPSLPIRPMKFTWGRPLVYDVNGRPHSPEIPGLDSRKPTTPPTTPPPSTTPPPVFVTKPLYSKINRTTITETNIVQINATHALEIKTPKTKPYRPDRTALSDKNGNPASFSSVFTEIAGSSGGIHDYFDKIAQSVGGPPPHKRTRHTKEIPPPPASPSSPPKKKKNTKRSEEEEHSDEEEEEDEEDVPEKPQKDQDQDLESDENEEEDEVDVNDDVNDDETPPKKPPPKIEDDEESPPQEDDEHDDTGVEEGSLKIKPKATPAPSLQKYSTQAKKKVKVIRNKSKTKKKQSSSSSSTEVAEDDSEPEDDYAEEDVPADDLTQDVLFAPKKKTNASKKKKKTKKQKAKPKPKDKTKEKEKEPEEEYDSEEVRKRNKAADEVQLPHFLSDEVKHAIREGIRNGHKEDHGKPKEGEQQEEEGASDEAEGQGPQDGSGSGYPAQYQQYSRPQSRPKRPGLFSFFG